MGKEIDLSALNEHLARRLANKEAKSKEPSLEIIAEAEALFDAIKDRLKDVDINNSADIVGIIESATVNSSFKEFKIRVKGNDRNAMKHVQHKFPIVAIGNYPQAAYNVWFENAPDDHDRKWMIICSKVPKGGNLREEN